MGYNREFELRMFLDEIVKLSHTMDAMREAVTGIGYPLSNLVNDSFSQRRLIKRITGTTDSNSHEFRLNGAGLKLYWRIDQVHNLLKINIGGDQANDYPFFVPRVRNIIKWNKNLR